MSKANREGNAPVLSYNVCGWVGATTFATRSRFLLSVELAPSHA